MSIRSQSLSWALPLVLALAGCTAPPAVPPFSGGPQLLRHAHGGGVVDGQLLLHGGLDSVSHRPANELAAYDLKGGTWRTLDDVPVFFAASAVWGDVLLSAGGLDKDSSPLAAVRVLDPDTLSWSSLPELAQARSRAAAAVLYGAEQGGAGQNGAVLVCGGRDESGDLASLEILDPGAGAWRLAAPMSSARHGHACVAYGGELWVLGGYNAEGRTDSVEIYDPRGDRWRAGPPLPAPRGFHAAVVMEDRLLVFCGRSPGNEPVEPTLRLSADGGAWELLPAPLEARNRYLAVVVDGEVWLVGGEGPGEALRGLQRWHP